jgi:hypothetical protein
MASLVLSGDTSGSVTLAAPAVAGSTTQTLVNVTGTLAPIVSGTAVASTSGTSIDFTDIPSWVKRITVMLSGVSTNGASPIICRIGSGGSVSTSGYVGNRATITNASSVSIIDVSTALHISSSPTTAAQCAATVVWLKVTGNTWVGTSSSRDAGTVTSTCNSTLDLAGALDIVRVTTNNGTDTFDAGTINILYE